MAKTITKVQASATQDTRTVVSELVGEHAMPIVTFLTGKEKTSEFIIAEELGMEINDVRNTLYRLLEHNLVSFLRKKDRVKGWYICYWDYHPHMVSYLKRKLRENRLERLRDRLRQEESAQHYLCRSGCQRVTFDEAMEIQFKCGECGSILQEQDNVRTKEFLREQIAQLERDTAKQACQIAPEPVAPVKTARKAVKKARPRVAARKRSVARTAPRKATGMARVLKKVFARR